MVEIQAALRTPAWQRTDQRNGRRRKEGEDSGSLSRSRRITQGAQGLRANTHSHSLGISGDFWGFMGDGANRTYRDVFFSFFYFFYYGSTEANCIVPLHVMLRIEFAFLFSRLDWGLGRKGRKQRKGEERKGKALMDRSASYSLFWHVRDVAYDGRYLYITTYLSAYLSVHRGARSRMAISLLGKRHGWGRADG